MARKTLVIGIGSTGMAICEDVLRRIEGEWGTTHRVPWLKTLAFETASVTDSYVGDRKLAFHIGLPSDKFQALQASPWAFDSTMEFSSWMDPQTIQMSGASDSGAGNVRMIGRASFLHQDSFSTFRNTVIQALDDLSKLQEPAATTQRGDLPDGSNPPVNFAPAITVYVCGTLTGGTCSGCFLDIAYFLRSRPGYSVEVVGLLGIPNVAYSVRVHQANAAAALMELNHFHCDGTKYHALFPGDTRSVDRIAERPFNSVFICAPTSGQAGAEAMINRSFGQFVYLSAVYTLGDIQADLINPGTAYSQLKDQNGPMSFATIGVGLVEYPAPHVIQACSYKLASIALKKWIEGIGVESGPANLIIQNEPKNGKAGLNLSQDAVRKEILKAPSGSDPFDHLIAREIANAEAAARAGDIGAMAETETNLEAAFSFNIPNRAIPSGLFLQAVKENGERMIPQRIEDLSEFFSRRLLTSDDGPVWCATFARILRDYCKQWKDANRSLDETKASLGELRGAMNRAKDRIDEANRAWSLKLGWKGIAVGFCLKEYSEAASQYWLERLNELSASIETALCDRIMDWCSMVESRINDPLHGMLAWSRSLQQALEREYRRLDENPPPVNGLLLYVAGKQVDTDYKACIDKVQNEVGAEYPPNIVGEEMARRRVVRQWSWVAEQLTAKPFASTFDLPDVASSQGKPLPVQPKHLSMLEALSRGYFKDLLMVSAVDRLMKNPNWQTEISNVDHKATAFLSINDALNPVGLPSPKGSLHLSRFAFFSGADPATPGTKAAELRDHLDPTIKHFVSLGEPHRIVIVEARSTFSIASIKGMDDLTDSTLKNAMESISQQQNVHSRMDVRWRALNAKADFPDKAICEARLLIGLAIDAITKSGPDKFCLSYPALGPNMPGGTIELSSDLDDAAFDLKANVGAYHVLSKIIDDFVALQGVQNLAPTLEEFLKSKLPAYRLTAGGAPLTTKTAAEKLRTFIVTVPNLEKALMALYPEAPSPNDYLVTATDVAHPVEGFYCKVCGTWLADSARPNDLPRKCSVCGAFLY